MSASEYVEAVPERAALKERKTYPHSRATIVGIMLLLGCSYMFNGMDRQVFPTLMEPIRAEFGLSLPEGAFINTSFALMIAICGGMTGWFMARFGRRATLVIGLISYSIFTFLTPFAFSFFDLAAYRFLTGGGEALHIGSIFAILGAYFGAQRGAAIGVVNSFFGVGAFLGPFLGARLFAWTGSWGLPFYIYGIAGFVTALLVLFLIPKDFCSAVDSESGTSAAAKQSTDGFFNRNLVLFSVGFFMLGYVFFAYGALYTSYLKSELGYSIVEAGTAFSFYGVGALSAVFCGWLGEKLKQLGMIVSVGLLAVVGYALFHGVTSQVAHSLLSLAFGALLSGYLYPRFIAVMQRSVKPEQIGYAMGLAVPLYYFPGLFAGYLFGVGVVSFGWSTAATLSVALPSVIGMICLALYDRQNMRGQ